MHCCQTFKMYLGWSPFHLKTLETAVCVNVSEVFLCLLSNILRTAPAGATAKSNDRGRKRIPQKQRTCEDCEENVATQFCSDCQPPLVLCDDCALLLHRGAKRRNHQLKG